MNDTDQTGDRPTVSHHEEESIERSTPRSNTVVRIQSGAFEREAHVVTLFLMGVGSFAVWRLMGDQSIVPFLGGACLVWLNMTLLIRGVKGVLEGRKRFLGVITLKLVVLLGGIFVLNHLFPKQLIEVILGCTVWLPALMWGSNASG